MKYLEFIFKAEPSDQTISDVLCAVLGETGFESFVEQEDGTLAAYIQAADYDENKLAELHNDKGIIRNRLKIKAAVTNAKVFIGIQQEHGSFDRYIWEFTDGKTIHETGCATSPLSDRISKELRRLGMKFVGSTIIYSYLQAIGIINSHEPTCWCAK